MKLIAIDLDGTLLNSEHKISTDNINALNKALSLGITVVISTGRTFESAKSIITEHNLQIPYLITCNGAIINDFHGNILNSFPVDKLSMEKAISFLYYNNYYFSLATKDSRIFIENSKNRLISDFYTTKIENPNLSESILDNLVSLFYDELNSLSSLSYTLDELVNFKEDIFGICAVSFNDKKLKEGLVALKDISNLSIFKSALNNFELTNEKCSKGNAIKILAKDLDINMDQTMAIGDNENDISMFEAVEFSVAMGNASKSIKDKCTFITLDNNSSGVSHAIENILTLTV